MRPSESTKSSQHLQKNKVQAAFHTPTTPSPILSGSLFNNKNKTKKPKTARWFPIKKIYSSPNGIVRAKISRKIIRFKTNWETP
ncbi:hypothetical protein [Neisseria elongata]|jgi:hypothetical protein|uniref:hypothetical protein n=1 Tax=Neisseria elongata TaxID=495 RepID=UPI00195905BE|nr:hypothetical protein [Neisseria elongata]MBM7065623.1 hypothetical protein [Neisseria elongata]